MKEIKIYLNKDRTKEVEDGVLDFGIVPAGEVKEFHFWLFNNSNHYFRNMKFKVDHPELEIKQAPKDLISHTAKELIIEWNCRIDVEEGLKTQIEIIAEKVIG